MKKHLFLFFMALMALGFMSCEKGSNEGGLNAPTGFKVSQSGSSLILEWQAVSGAESYSLTKNDQFWQTTSATRSTAATQTAPKEPISHMTTVRLRQRKRLFCGTNLTTPTPTTSPEVKATRL